MFSKLDKYLNLINPDSCQGVGVVQDINKKTSILSDFQVKFDKKYGHIKKIMNYTNDYFMKYDNLVKFCDAITCAHFDRRDLSFLNVNSSLINNECQQLMKLDKYYVSLQSEENLISNMAMTPIMNKFLLYLDSLIKLENKKILDSAEYSKFSLYSTMASNIALYQSFFTHALKLKKNLEYIPFGSNILIEFHKLDKTPEIADDSHFYIQIYYNEEILYNDNYMKFKKAISPLLVDSFQIDEFCGFSDNSGFYYLIAIIILAFISLGLGIWILLLLFKTKPAEQPVLPLNR